MNMGEVIKCAYSFCGKKVCLRDRQLDIPHNIPHCPRYTELNLPFGYGECLIFVMTECFLMAKRNLRASETKRQRRDDISEPLLYVVSAL